MPLPINSADDAYFGSWQFCASVFWQTAQQPPDYRLSTGNQNPGPNYKRTPASFKHYYDGKYQDSNWLWGLDKPFYKHNQKASLDKNHGISQICEASVWWLPNENS